MKDVGVFDPEETENVKDLLVFALDIALFVRVFDTDDQLFTALFATRRFPICISPVGLGAKRNIDYPDFF